MNSSLFLASNVRSKLGFLGKNLEVFLSWVHFTLKSKHLERRLQYYYSSDKKEEKQLISLIDSLLIN